MLTMDIHSERVGLGNYCLKGQVERSKVHQNVERAKVEGSVLAIGLLPIRRPTSKAAAITQKKYRSPRLFHVMRSTSIPTRYATQAQCIYDL
jgi:hypothetical protein